MAGRSVKKKNSTAPLKKAVTLIAVFVVLLFTVLDLTGLFLSCLRAFLWSYYAHFLYLVHDTGGSRETEL